MPYIGNTIRAADDYRLIDDISSSFNGSNTSFALQVAGSAPVPFPKSPQQVLISVNGVIQEPDPTGASGFNLVGTNIVFSSAPTNGHAFFGIIYATADYLNSGGNFPSGSTGSPSLTFIGDEDTGIYRKGSGSVGFVSNSTEIANTDSNGITISSGNLILGDSAGASSDRVVLGASSDLSIYHDGSHSYIEDSGTGKLRILTSELLIANPSDNENIAKFIQNGAVELYHDNSKKFETLTDGVKTNGDLTVNNANKLYLENDSENKSSYIFNSAASTHADITFYTAETGGTAANRWQITKSGMLITATDSTYDIGENSNRVRNGYFDTLYGDGSNLTGINTDLVSDTSPQLGGDLDTNGNNITFDDNDQLRLGNATGGDIVIAHKTSDNNGHIENHTGDLLISTKGAGDDVIIEAVDDIELKPKGGENGIKVIGDGAVQLYNNNDLVLSTKSQGINVRGNLHAAPAGTTFATDNDTYVLQAAAPSQAYMSAYAANTGTNLFNHGIHVGIDTSTANIIVRENKNLNFYTNDAHRLTLQNNGNLIPAANNSFNLGATSNRWANVYTNDLNLSNEGSSNDVDSTWGDYTIQEGFEDLFLINNRTGKKFKFNLTEVS